MNITIALVFFLNTRCVVLVDAINRFQIFLCFQTIRFFSELVLGDCTQIPRLSLFDAVDIGSRLAASSSSILNERRNLEAVVVLGVVWKYLSIGLA